MRHAGLRPSFLQPPQLPPRLLSQLPRRVLLLHAVWLLLQLDLHLLHQPGRRLVRPGQLRRGHRRLHPGDRQRSPLCLGLRSARCRPWYCKGEFDKAIADDTLAIANNRSYAAAYNNRAAAWDAQNEFDKALADVNIALALEPSYVEAYVSRSAIWYNKGEFDKAVADDNAALAIDPNMAQAYADRGIRLGPQGRIRQGQGRLRPGPRHRRQQRGLHRRPGVLPGDLSRSAVPQWPAGLCQC